MKLKSRIPAGCLSGACLIILLSLSAAWAQPAKYSSNERAALEAADTRDLKKLLDRLGSSSALDALVLNALGSFQDPVATKVIVKHLDSGDPAVRKAAAFALGQTPVTAKDQKSRDELLLDHIQKESDQDVRAALMTALGRSGSVAALDKLAGMEFDSEVLRDGQADAIARFAIRGLISKPAVDRIASILLKLDPADARERLVSAAYAFQRIGDVRLLAPHEDLLKRWASAANPQARISAVSALARMGTPGSWPAIMTAVSDPDWRVRVSALRGLAVPAADADARKHIGEILARTVRSGSYNERKMALQVLGRAGITDSACRNAVLAAVVDRNPDIGIEAMASLCMAFPADAAKALSDSLSRSPDASAIVLKGVGLLAARESRIRDEFMMPLAMCILYPDRVKSFTALESWITCLKVAMGSGKPPAEIQRFKQTLITSLFYNCEPTSSNPAAVEMAVQAMSDSLIRVNAFLKPMLESFEKMDKASDLEAVLVYIDALASFNDKSVVPVLKPFLTNPNPALRQRAWSALTRLKQKPAPVDDIYRGTRQMDWNAIEAVPVHPIVTITTTKGVIKAELYPEDALFTVEAFLRLVRQGFYNGLTFHRVVPNFVVQGGDPNGDGSGGPSFTLRSEFSRRSFSRGALGVASSGRDTEGSQFFFMHSCAPHLDGKYTLFGGVLEGMQVVDKLEVGDSIISIAVNP
jgi:peptidylprolyl isomerase